MGVRSQTLPGVVRFRLRHDNGPIGQRAGALPFGSCCLGMSSRLSSHSAIPALPLTGQYRRSRAPAYCVTMEPCHRSEGNEP